MYDAFMSYSSKDKEEAEKLVKDLTRKGLKIWFDGWEMRPGDSLIECISQGVDQSSFLFALLSPNSVSSRWVKQELRQAMTAEVQMEQVKVVPLLLRRCELPDFIEGKHYVDLTEPSLYEHSLQKLVDLVFDEPRTAGRPLFAEELFEEYREMLDATGVDIQRFSDTARRVLKVLQANHVPTEAYGYPEGSYFASREMLAEASLILGRLPDAAEAYASAYEYALERRNPDLMFQAGVPRFCVLCFRSELEGARSFLRDFLSQLEDLVKDDGSLSFDAVLEYVVRVCFFESLGVRDPLHVVFRGDHHALNLRVERTCDVLFELIADSDFGEHNAHAVYGAMLEQLGLLRLALKHFRVAGQEGDKDAQRQIEALRESQENALRMAPFFRGEEVGAPPPGTHLTMNLSNPRAFARTMMCSGVYVEVPELASGIAERLVERKQPRSKIKTETNGVSPVRIMIYEDQPGSSKGIASALKAMKIGVATVRSDDQAKAALGRYRKIRLFVSDHHFQRSGMVSISGALFERDCLEKEHPGIVSTILTNNPEAKSPQEDVSYGFRTGGGDFVTDCRSKTDAEIAAELGALLDR